MEYFLAVVILATCFGTSLPQGNSYKRVCYYTNWSQYRNNDMKFFPMHVEPFMCSHLQYAFAQITNGRLDKYEWNDENSYQELVQIRDGMSPNLKLILSVGGWNHGSERFSTMVSTPETRTTFIDSSIEYVRRIGFNGLDINWQYPGQRGGAPEDRERFTLFLQEARQAFSAEANATGQTPLLLTAALAANTDTANVTYEVESLAKELDFVDIMSYDMHPQQFTGHQSPVFSRQDDSDFFKRLNYEYVSNWYLNEGVPAEKIIMGFAASAKTYTLQSETNNSMGAPVTGPGAGGVGGIAGTKYYYEACQELNQANVTKTWNEEQKVPFYTVGDQWAGYDDANSVGEKAKYVKQQRLGGMMMWELSLDDFMNNKCNEGRYPLLKAMYDELTSSSTHERRT